MIEEVLLRHGQDKEAVHIQLIINDLAEFISHTIDPTTSDDDAKALWMDRIKLCAQSNGVRIVSIIIYLCVT